VILRSFAATSIWPMNRDRVLKRFPPKLPSEPNNKPEPTWREADRLLHQAINTSSSKAKKLSALLHHLANKNELLTDENESLRNTLSTKKKHYKKGKVLDLQQREEYHGGAIFWSPRKKREAEARDATNRRLADKDKLKKAEMKNLKAANVLYNKKLKEQRHVATATKKEKRKKAKAEKAAEKAAQTVLQNTKKSIQTSQTGKRKASRVTAPKAKRQKRSGGVAAPAEAVPAAPAKVVRSG
jgi:hypothetical protein